jgi:hypothetical protein
MQVTTNRNSISTEQNKSRHLPKLVMHKVHMHITSRCIDVDSDSNEVFNSPTLSISNRWLVCWKLASLLLTVRLFGCWLLLRIKNAHVIRQRAFRSDLARRVPRQHDFDFDTKDSCRLQEKFHQSIVVTAE